MICATVIYIHIYEFLFSALPHIKINNEYLIASRYVISMLPSNSLNQCNLSERSKGAGVSIPSSEDRNRISFRNVFSIGSEFRTKDKVPKPSESECNMQSSELFRFY
jgi:hypothetical protein